MARQKVTNTQLNFTNGSGYIYVGPLIIQWGTVTTSSIATPAGSEVSGTITFPVAYGSAPVAICNPSDLANACAEYAFITSTTTTTASYYAGHAIASGAAGTMTVRWIAIGTA